MKYSVELVRAVHKVLQELPRSDTKKIAKKIQGLETNPFPRGYEKMAGKNELYRIRSGDYRILYHVYAGKLLILVVKVGHRREVYRT